MALQQRLDSLEQRHEALQAAILLEEASLAVDDLHVREMKKQRLRLKDELQSLAAAGYSTQH